MSLASSTFAAAFVLGLSAAAGATDATVRVTDARGAPLSGVSVCACHVAANGPDGESRLAVTDGTGAAVFSLADGVRYEVLAAAQGYAPGLRAQYVDPKHLYLAPDGEPVSATVVLTPSAPAGEVDAAVSGAVPGGVVLAGVQPAGSSLALADGLSVADASGRALVRVYNVPFAAAGALVLTAYEPDAGKVSASTLDRALTAAAALLTRSLDFNAKPAVALIKGWAYGGRDVKLSYAVAVGPSFRVAPKTLTLARANDAAFDTTGTVFLLSLPPDAGGAGHVEIFARAGTPVRRLDLGELAGGSDYYVEWDGKDDAGAAAPPGAYYGVFSQPGEARNAMIKLAVTR